jgi:cob(I)alamin adenosyltransferase
VAKIYTKTGDDGTTGLIGSERVAKDCLRIEAIGSLDELNAFLGVVRSHALPAEVDQTLGRIQNDLFTIGSVLATPQKLETAGRQILDEDVRMLENDIDRYEGSLSPLKNFILPGGTGAGAALHLSRAVARRAERQCVALARHETLNPRIFQYLNRLSDLCFVLARYVNLRQSAPEPHAVVDRPVPDANTAKEG